MSLPRSREVVPELIELDTSPSTNEALVALAAANTTPEFTTVVTRDQTAGRGRLGRDWVAAPGTALAISVLLRPLVDGRPLPLAGYGWLPIAAGVAMAETVAEQVTSASVGFKWPNDVLIGGRKVCGILAELLPPGAGADAGGVVIGAGINLTMSESELPVPSATSLVLAGVAAEPGLDDRVLAGYLTRLRRHLHGYLDAGGDAEASGLRARARELCVTLGQAVRVELPGGVLLTGTANDLDESGQLVVLDANGRTRSVAAGDVTHVR